MKKIFIAIVIGLVSYGAYATHNSGSQLVKSRASQIDAAVNAAVGN